MSEIMYEFQMNDIDLNITEIIYRVVSHDIKLNISEMICVGLFGFNYFPPPQDADVLLWIYFSWWWSFKFKLLDVRLLIFEHYLPVVEFN